MILRPMSHNMQVGFMNEVKHKDVARQETLIFIISICKATGSCENRFSNPLYNYTLQSHMYLIKEKIIEKPECKNNTGGQRLRPVERWRKGEEFGYGKTHVAHGKW